MRYIIFFILLNKFLLADDILAKNQALQNLKIACKNNDAKACYELGLKYFDGKMYLEKSCELAYAKACNKLADIYILDINKSRFYNKLSCEYGNDFDCVASFDDEAIDYERLARYCKDGKKYTCDYLRKHSIKHKNLKYFVKTNEKYEKLYNLCLDDNAKACFTLALNIDDLKIFADDLYKKACLLEKNFCIFKKVKK